MFYSTRVFAQPIGRPPGGAIDPAHRDQGEAEVSNPGQQAVQGGLVDHGPGDRRLADGRVRQLEPIEPGRPASVEVGADRGLRQPNPATSLPKTAVEAGSQSHLHRGISFRSCVPSRSSGGSLIPSDEVPQSRGELGPVANADLPEHV